jgi:hypothetical protein
LPAQAPFLRMHSKLRASVLKSSNGGDDWLLLVLSLNLEGVPLVDCYGFARLAKLLLGDMQPHYTDMDLRDTFELCNHNRSRYATLAIEDAILFTLMPTPQARILLPSHPGASPIHTLPASSHGSRSCLTPLIRRQIRNLLRLGSFQYYLRQKDGTAIADAMARRPTLLEMKGVCVCISPLHAVPLLAHCHGPHPSCLCRCSTA